MSNTITLPPLTNTPRHGTASLRPASSKQLQVRKQLQQRYQVQQQQQQQQNQYLSNFPRRLPVIFLDPQRLTSAASSRIRERINPSTLFAPARKTLSTLESQRIMGVVMEAVKKMDLVLALSQALEKIIRVAEGLGEQELVGLLDEHAALLDELEDLVSADNERPRTSASGATSDEPVDTSEEQGHNPEDEFTNPNGLHTKATEKDQASESFGARSEAVEAPENTTDDEQMVTDTKNLGSCTFEKVEESILKDVLKNENETEKEELQNLSVDEERQDKESNQSLSGIANDPPEGIQANVLDEDIIRIENNQADVNLLNNLDEIQENFLESRLKSEDEDDLHNASSLISGEEGKSTTDQDMTVSESTNIRKSSVIKRNNCLASISALDDSDIIPRLQDSARNILRIIARHPDIAKEILLSLNEDDDVYDENDNVELVSGRKVARSVMEELKGFAMKKLLTTPVELRMQEKHAAELEKRINENDAVNDKLEAELLAAEEERDNNIKEKNEIIRRLQTDLNRIERQSEERIQYLKLEGPRNQAAELTACEEKCSALRQEFNQIRGQHNSLLTQHRESEMVLRKRKFQIETEIENLIQKYDNDMGEKQDEYDQIDFVYTEEKRQLRELEERFRTLEVEYNSIVAVRRAAREARETAERELMLAVRAATAIQAYWRSYRVRKAMKSRKRRGGARRK